MRNTPNNSPQISIHAPREGGDHKKLLRTFFEHLFQSTPPARGATPENWQEQEIRIISIHAPREGGDFTSQWIEVKMIISIHAPREGGDTKISL